MEEWWGGTFRHADILTKLVQRASGRVGQGLQHVPAGTPTSSPIPGGSAWINQVGPKRPKQVSVLRCNAYTLYHYLCSVAIQITAINKMQEVRKKGGGPLTPPLQGQKGRLLLAFVSPTSALVTGRRDRYLFMIVAFVEVAILCFAF